MIKSGRPPIVAVKTMRHNQKELEHVFGGRFKLTESKKVKL